MNSSSDQSSKIEGPRRMGGGPRLRLAEWLALIHLHQRHGADRGSLHLALVEASCLLEAAAAKTGRARTGTRLRSPAGLRRRLTVVRKLETGQSEKLPSDAIAAWQLFVSSPAEARSLAMLTLGLGNASPDTEWQPSIGPTRGPEPSFGLFAFEREDGSTAVYAMVLQGPSATHLAGAEDGRFFVKVGRSADTVRRLEEMNWGYPPGCGLEWNLVADRQFPSAETAHAFEQALLARLHREGLCIGGEYARVQADRLSSLLWDSAEIPR